MTTATTYFPNHSGDVWVLANATVCDARDVASELPTKPAALRDFLEALWTVVGTSLHLRGDFIRLADRQGKLIVTLRAAAIEEWSVETCAEMADLLEDLVKDEDQMLYRAFGIPKVLRWLWETSLFRLKSQVGEIKDMYIHMDALSVVVTDMPGDDDMREFVSTLGQSEEFDFEVDRDLRKELVPR